MRFHVYMAFLENSNGFFGTVDLLLWPARNVFLHVYMAFLENSNGFFGTVDLLLWPARKAFCIHFFCMRPTFCEVFLSERGEILLELQGQVWA